MAAVFLKLLNLSISASWLVLAVLALRLISKRSPKWMNVLLWGIVALRLTLRQKAAQKPKRAYLGNAGKR